MALPDGLNSILNSGSLGEKLDQASLNEKLTRDQQDLHKDSSLWPSFTTNEGTKQLIDDVKSIKSSAKFMEDASKYILQEKRLPSKEKPTLNDLVSLNPAHSYGFLYLAEHLGGLSRSSEKKTLTSNQPSLFSSPWVKAAGLGAIVAALAAAMPMLSSAIFNKDAIQADPETALARKEYLKTYTLAILEAKTKVATTLGAPLSAVASLVGNVMGEVVGGFSSTILSSVFDIETTKELLKSNEDVKKAREDYLSANIKAIAKAKQELTPNYADAIAHLNLSGQVGGSFIGGLVEGALKSVYNVELYKELMAEDPLVREAQKNLIKDQVVAIQEVSTEALKDPSLQADLKKGLSTGAAAGNFITGLLGAFYDFAEARREVEDGKDDVVANIKNTLADSAEAIALVAGPIIGGFAAFGQVTIAKTIGRLESIVDFALDTYQMTTSEELIQKRVEGLGSILDATYKSEVWTEGIAAVLSGIVEGISKVKLAKVVGFAESIADFALDTKELATNEVLKQKRINQLAYIMDMYYGADFATAFVAAPLGAILQGLGQVKAAAYIGIAESIADFATDTVFLATDDDLVARRKAHLLEMYNITAAHEIEVAKSGLGKAESWVAGAAGVISAFFGSKDFTAKVQLASTDKEASEIKMALADKYASAIRATPLTQDSNFKLPKINSVVEGLASGLAASAWRFTYDWENASAGTKTILTNRYMTAVTDYYEKQLAIAAEEPLAAGVGESFYKQLFKATDIKANVGTLNYKLISDTADIDADEFTINAGIVNLVAENFETEVEEAEAAPRWAISLESVLQDVKASLDALAAAKQAAAPSPIVNNTIIAPPASKGAGSYLGI